MDFSNVSALEDTRKPYKGSDLINRVVIPCLARASANSFFMQDIPAPISRVTTLFLPNSIRLLRHSQTNYELTTLQFSIWMTIWRSERMTSSDPDRPYQGWTERIFSLHRFPYGKCPLPCVLNLYSCPNSFRCSWSSRIPNNRVVLLPVRTDSMLLLIVISSKDLKNIS